MSILDKEDVTGTLKSFFLIRERKMEIQDSRQQCNGWKRGSIRLFDGAGRKVGAKKGQWKGRSKERGKCQRERERGQRGAKEEPRERPRERPREG